MSTKKASKSVAQNLLEKLAISFQKTLTTPPYEAAQKTASTYEGALDGLALYVDRMATRMAYDARIFGAMAEGLSYTSGCVKAAGESIADKDEEEPVTWLPRPEDVMSKEFMDSLPKMAEIKADYIIAVTEGKTSFYGPYTNEEAVRILSTGPKNLNWDLYGKPRKGARVFPPEALDPSKIDLEVS